MLYTLLAEFNLMYLVGVRPYSDPFSNANEIFNEMCVLAVAYQLFVFTDFVDSVEIKDQVGLSLIAVILGNFGINLGIQLYNTIRMLPRTIRKIKRRFCKDSPA